MKSLRRVGSVLGLALVLIAAACSDNDDGSNGAGTDGGACGRIGDSCAAGTNDCPQGLKCEDVGERDFCAPQHEPCGGFAGGTCPASAPHCMVVGGAADYGLCMTADERQCACTKTPQSFTAASCGIR